MNRVCVSVLIFAIGCKNAAPVDPDDTDPATIDVPTEPQDTDGDGIDDPDDNCPSVANVDQADLDGDGWGDVCDDDVDGDSIPDLADLFPQDGDRPGRANDQTVYAHTADAIYTFDVNDYGVELVGTVDLGTLTDLAIDRYGVMWVMTFTELYVCHPQTVECWLRGALPSDGNGLTFVPQGTIESDRDSLIAIAQTGAWGLVEPNPTGAEATITPIGGYGDGYASSGDAFSILGTGTFAAVTSDADGVEIVEVDPTNGTVLATVTVLDTGGIWGMAGWDDVIFAFDAGGEVYSVDPVNGAVSTVAVEDVSWYGAGVATETVQPAQ